MPRGNVETVRRTVEALRLDPDIEWEHALGSGAPEEGVYRGRDEVRSRESRESQDGVMRP